METKRNCPAKTYSNPELADLYLSYLVFHEDTPLQEDHKRRAHAIRDAEVDLFEHYRAQGDLSGAGLMSETEKILQFILADGLFVMAQTEMETARIEREDKSLAYLLDFSNTRLARMGKKIPSRIREGHDYDGLAERD